MLPFVGSKLLHHKSEMHAKTKRSKQTFSSRGSSARSSLHPSQSLTHPPHRHPHTHPSLRELLAFEATPQSIREMPQVTTKNTEHLAPSSQKSGIMLPFVGSKVLHHESEMHAKTKRSEQTGTSRWGARRAPSFPPPGEWHHVAFRRFKTLTPQVRNACKNQAIQADFQL